MVLHDRKVSLGRMRRCKHYALSVKKMRSPKRIRGCFERASSKSGLLHIEQTLFSGGVQGISMDGVSVREDPIMLDALMQVQVDLI